MRIYQAITIFAVAAAALPTQHIAARDGPEGNAGSHPALQDARPEQSQPQDRPPAGIENHSPVVVEDHPPVQDHPLVVVDDHPPPQRLPPAVSDGTPAPQDHPAESSNRGPDSDRPVTHDRPADGGRPPPVTENRPPVVVEDHPNPEVPHDSGSRSSRPPVHQHFEKVEHPDGNPNNMEMTTHDIIDDNQRGIHSNVVHHVTNTNTIVNGKPVNVDVHGTSGVHNNGRNNVVLPGGAWKQLNFGQPGAGLPGANFIPAGLGSTNGSPPSGH